MTAEEQAREDDQSDQSDQDDLAARAGVSPLPGLDDRDPVWQLTDWTAWQRTHAVAGELVAAAACGLLAWSLAHWFSQPLAATTGPIAVTLLSLGVALIHAAYWYRYCLATNCVGQRARQMEALVNLMGLEALVALGVLGVQVIGAALAARVHFPLWQDFGPYAYVVPAMLGFVAFGGSLTMVSGIAWTPTRTSDTPGGPLTAQPHGVRLLLRWLVMVLIIRAGILIAAPAVILVLGNNALWGGIRSFLFPIQPITRDFALVALFFLITALSELSLWVQVRSQAQR